MVDRMPVHTLLEPVHWLSISLGKMELFFQFCWVNVTAGTSIVTLSRCLWSNRKLVTFFNVKEKL